MTREEKAQAYDEALERARKQKYDYQKEFDKTDKNSQLAEILRAGISAIELAFPELAESEDERIRKELANFLRSSFIKENLTDEKVAPWIAYLEKPKEPIDPFDTKLFQDGVKEGRRLEREDIKKEQQPAEWSEEDENNLELVIDCIYKFYPDPVMKYKLKEWLKSLRPVKQEWSDEDEKMRRNLMSLLANMRGDRITEETYQKYYSWLKSLRPPKDCSDCAKHLEGYISGRSDAENKLLEQFGALVTPEGELHIKSRWKPSEEQILAIVEALKYLPNNKDEWMILNTLIDFLKKLM